MTDTLAVPAKWTARWIWDEGIPRTTPVEHEFRLFRRAFQAGSGAKLVIHVTADSRYQLFLNGERVSIGPCKGDAWRKHYETVDLSDRLKPGRNVLAARVLHFRPAEPPHFNTIGISSVTRTASGGFLLQGTVEGGECIDTDQKWRAGADTSVTFHFNEGSQLLGETESVDGALSPHGWQTPEYDDSAWKPAVQFWDGLTPEQTLNYEFSGPWSLTPRTIPPMFETKHTFDVLNGPVTVPPHTTWTRDLDARELTTAYPTLRVSGGKGSKIKLVYAEAYGEGEEGKAWIKKGIRDNPEGRGIFGQWDQYSPNGGVETYQPFWFRTFRFIRIKVVTGDDPMTLDSLSYIETGYPLDVKSTFESSEPRYQPLWDISIRTVRRCMQETYVDCPYYEQLQYAMDTRLEALYSSYLSADDRLMRKAIHDYHCSWHPSGLLQSRTPCVYPQIIPGFSLHWILMLHDHWRLFGDPALPRRYRSTVDSVLDWFDRKLTPDGLVGGFGYWPYFDWVKGWNGGCPPPAPDAPSSVFSLMYAASLNLAAELSEPAGYPSRAEEYHQRARVVNQAVNAHCWDSAKGVYKDGPDHDTYAMHPQVWAVLSGASTGRKAAALMERTLGDHSMAQMNWAMQFYLFRALRQTGMYERAFPLFQGWLDLVDLHVTTWPEDPVNGRSDCHAWGSVPIYEFMAEILGVQPAEPGFAAIRVDPQPGPLSWAKGTVITPRGPVSVSWTKVPSGLKVDAKGPEGVRMDVRGSGG
ncbi:MAG TPA: alpha-L-rhamnosidase C-terminal domain-containing protein [Armatimonadota bacterium]|jgi:hypothetical protein